jgi:hypothetical protein
MALCHPVARSVSVISTVHLKPYLLKLFTLHRATIRGLRQPALLPFPQLQLVVVLGVVLVTMAALVAAHLVTKIIFLLRPVLHIR